MAVEDENPKPLFSSPSSTECCSALLSSYVGISFAVFLGFLPRSSISHVASLQSRNRILSLKLFHAEDQLRQMRFRRKEDSKANARVVEIFASHRHAWQEEEKRLLLRIDAAAEQVSALRSRISELESSEIELRSAVEGLQREVAERDDMLDYMSNRVEVPVVAEEGEVGHKEAEEVLVDEEDERDYCGDYTKIARVILPEGKDPAVEASFVDWSGELEEMAMTYCQESGFGRDYFQAAATSELLMQSPSRGWQDNHFDSLQSTYHVKHLLARREYPWKVGSDSVGISSKLKLLEEELCNLEKIGKGEVSKVPSLLRKQAKRHQSLASKIDDLCRRMQVSEPCESSLSPEFRTQRQAEFLMEALRLQHRATETRQKLTPVHAEAAKSYLGDELTAQGKISARRSIDFIRSNMKEIQRNLEIWLARIMGDLEGILARDGAPRVREYYISRYPFVQ
ncbi:hypothetical protein AXF42_Ash014103 [Apostasia shenzhenica]|uniref:Uncharacterized protein n=1 Tax=Apostasia shenzhenica TaxID=1088818 RepID=A0A2I0A9E2_9ASPA|nr:hypothetical protein AXF42_Ash014103 [Apostasia shenzhenica]